MQVYIEYVLIDNLVIDYLLLKATFAVTGKAYRRGRLFVCALLGALIALLFPLIESVGAISVIVKILSGLLIVLLASKYDYFRQYYISVVVFFFFTFLSGGAIIGVFSLLNISYSSELSIALMAVPAYIIISGMLSVVKFLYRRREIVRAVCDVEIYLKKERVSCKGFFDTGNGLYDGERPVIVCGERLAKKILGNFQGVKIKRLTVNTVSGESKNLAFEIDLIKIYIGDEPNMYNNVTVCVSGEFLGDDYDVILHPSLMEDRNVNKCCEKIEKVS